MTTIEPVGEQRLRELITRIRGEHDGTTAALASALDHAVRCGEALIEAKTLVPPGGWGDWLDSNVPVSRQIASGYMRLAAFKDSLDQSLTITSNLQLLRGMPPMRRGTPRLPEGTREEALRMHDAGGSISEIARALGITKDTVRGWVRPDWRDRRREELNADARTRRATAALERRAAADEQTQDAPAAHETPEARTVRLGTSFGEPGRAAIGQAIRGLAKVQTVPQTLDAIDVLIAVAVLWRRRLARDTSKEPDA